MQRLAWRWALLGAAWIAAQAQALEFEIYQRTQQPPAVALLVRAPDAKAGQTLRRIVERDWKISQALDPIDPMLFIADEDETWKQPVYADWRIIGADALVLARVEKRNEKLFVAVQVHDPFRMREIRRSELFATDLADAAHAIADVAFAAIVGIPGHFRSRLIYVRRTKLGDWLVQARSNGDAPRIIAGPFSILLSPDPAPKGDAIAATVFVHGKPRVVRIALDTKQSETIAAFEGLNSTPAFSPDGRHLALTLSRQGNVDIYLVDLATHEWKRLTRSRAIDTSPTFAPNGRAIAFVSNRSGSPQIYRLDLATGKIERITHEGRYNTAPAWSPRGDRIAYVAMKDFRFAIATIRPDGSELRYLVEGTRIESPAWTPNGWMIAYAREENGWRRIELIPAQGGRPVILTRRNENASDPAWLPPAKRPTQ